MRSGDTGTKNGFQGTERSRRIRCIGFGQQSLCSLFLAVFFLLFLIFVIIETFRFFRRHIHTDGKNSFWGYIRYRASLVLQEWKYSNLLLLVAFTFFVLTASIIAQMWWPRRDYELLQHTFKPPDLPEATWDAWKWVIAPDAGGAQRTPYGRFIGVLTCLGGLTVFALLISVISAGFADWLQGIRDGVGPVIEGGHVLVLGWSENATQLIQELAKGRESPGRSNMSSVVVILTRDRQNVLNQLSNILPVQGIHVTVRQGSAYRRNHLENVSAASAEAIIVLNSKFQAPSMADYNTCAVLRVLKDHNWPRTGHVVALCVEDSNMDTIKGAAGPKPLILEPCTIGAQMIRKCIMTPAWPWFLNEVFGHGSQALSVLCWNAAPKQFKEMQHEYLGAVPIGVIASDGGPMLCPNHQYKVRPGDSVLLVQASFAQAIGSGGKNQKVRHFHPPLKTDAKLRLVILGWNVMGPHVCRELDNCMKGEIHVASRSSTEKRIRQLAEFEHDFKVKISHYESTSSLKSCMKEADVASADVLIFLAEESCGTEEPRLIDEETTSAVVASMQVLAASETQPPIYVEILDRESELHLIDAQSRSAIDRTGNSQLASRLLSVGMPMDSMSHLNTATPITTVNSAQLLYRISAMIAEERRLGPVLAALPDLVLEEVSLPEGQGGSFLDAMSFLTSSLATDGNVSRVALGWRMKGHWELNPKDKTKKYEWAKGDRVLALNKIVQGTGGRLPSLSE